MQKAGEGEQNQKVTGIAGLASEPELGTKRIGTRTKRRFKTVLSSE